MARIRTIPQSEWEAHLSWAGTSPQIYVIQEGHDGPCKVGFSRNAEWRRSSLNAGNCRQLHLRHVWQCDCRANALMIEAAVLQNFTLQRIRGEWIDAHPDDLAKFIEAGWVNVST